MRAAPPLKAGGGLLFMRIYPTDKESSVVELVRKNFTVDQGDRIWSNALGRIPFFFRCAYSSGAASGFLLIFTRSRSSFLS